MLLGKKRGRFRTALGDDQIQDGNGFSVLDQLIAFTFHKRFQVNAQITERLTARCCHLEWRMVGGKDEAGFEGRQFSCNSQATPAQACRSGQD